MDAVLFLALPAAVAVGSAMICYVLMSARMEVVVARERAERARIEARLEMTEEMMPERLKAAEDAVISGLHVEERRYVREASGGTPATVVLQERLYFRKIPLSNWIEHELPVSAGPSGESLSVFTPPQTGPAPRKGPQLLRSGGRPIAV
jgi:hypothetical protein